MESPDHSATSMLDQDQACQLKSVFRGTSLMGKLIALGAQLPTPVGSLASSDKTSPEEIS
jgi:hypothetical protein